MVYRDLAAIVMIRPATSPMPFRGQCGREQFRESADHDRNVEITPNTLSGGADAPASKVRIARQALDRVNQISGISRTNEHAALVAADELGQPPDGGSDECHAGGCRLQHRHAETLNVAAKNRYVDAGQQVRYVVARTDQAQDFAIEA
jgi:hypothetical protein